MNNRSLTTMSEVFACSIEAQVDEDFTLEESFLQWLDDSPISIDLALVVASRLGLDFTHEMEMRCYSYDEQTGGFGAEMYL
jgi:hypothetical protein